MNPTFHRILDDRNFDAVRQELGMFYGTATPEDAGLMSALILAHTSASTAMSAPRENLGSALTAELERATTEHTRLFTTLRARVCMCPTYLALSEADKKTVEQLVFRLHSE